MEVDLNRKFIGEVLLSGRIREIDFERAQTAQWLWQSRVGYDTGQLARSAHAFTEIGGVRHDRWIGVLVFGTGLEYGAAEEFGHRAGKRVQRVAGRLSKKRAAQINAARRFIPGAHDLNAVLEELGST